MPKLKEGKPATFTRQSFLKDLRKVSQRIEKPKVSPKQSKT